VIELIVCVCAVQTTDAEADMSELLAGTTPAPTPGFEGMEQVMAAIGFPSAPPPARRGVLSGELFEEPEEGVKVSASFVILSVR
jgi:hypothetical protein